MKTKTVTVEQEKPYSKEQLNRIEKAFKKIQEAKKDPEFMKAIERFIKMTT